MPRKIGRDAGTGQLMPAAKAQKNPGATVMGMLPTSKKQR